MDTTVIRQADVCRSLRRPAAVTFGLISAPLAFDLDLKALNDVYLLDLDDMEWRPYEHSIFASPRAGVMI